MRCRDDFTTRRGSLPILAALLATLVFGIALAPGAGAPTSGEDGLLAHWRFGPDDFDGKVVEDRTGRWPGRVEGRLALATNPGSARLDGRGHIALHEGAWPDSLFTEAFSVEAWVRMDVHLEWGGILSFIQDNGNFEKGWLLGTRQDRFAFALSTTGADDGDGRLTYLTSKTTIALDQWYHVTATYDGKVQRLHIDGELDAESREQSGPVLFPERSWFDLGAYHDDNELYRLKGRLHEVRLHDRALGTEEIARRHDEMAPDFPRALQLTAMPEVTHGSEGRTTISFTIPDAGTCVVRYGGTESLSRIARSEQRGGGRP